MREVPLVAGDEAGFAEQAGGGGGAAAPLSGLIRQHVYLFLANENGPGKRGSSNNKLAPRTKMDIGQNNNCCMIALLSRMIIMRNQFIAKIMTRNHHVY